MSQRKISFEDVDFNITNFTRDGNGQLQAEMTLDVPRVGEVQRAKIKKFDTRKVT